MNSPHYATGVLSAAGSRPEDVAPPLRWTPEIEAGHPSAGFGEVTGPITEPGPLTLPGELSPELTGPLDSEWMRLPSDEESRRADARGPADGLNVLDTQRLHPLPGPQAPPVSRISITLGGQIGRYTLERRLGSGGLGTVWSAYDTVLARQVAIKTLPLHVPETEREAVAERVLDEARAAARLSHPHIVTVHDAGIAGEGAYLAMELLRGKDLAELLRSGWQPTAEQAALIVRRVADALGYAHAKGVIHRDIKPANIFMVGRTRPVVLDFGIARLMHQADDPSPALGSPYYAAPEQFDGRECDQRSDVYSLGVVLYELLCGARPFQGASLPEIRAAVRAGQPLPPGSHRPGVPAALEAIALKALSRDPAQRQRSAGALARELRAWLANPAAAAAASGVPVPSAAPSANASATVLPGSVRTSGAAVQRNPVAAGAAPAGRSAALSPLPPPLDTGRPLPPVDDEATAPPRTHRLRSLLWAVGGSAVAALAAWLLWISR
ncbi:MAG: serine/threonine protein kinase [Burkholderiaceae bacterium]|nr:serine/threonine protein kinase [Burkholderiaceae bacterium]